MNEMLDEKTINDYIVNFKIKPLIKSISNLMNDFVDSALELDTPSIPDEKAALKLFIDAIGSTFNTLLDHSDAPSVIMNEIIYKFDSLYFKQPHDSYEDALLHLFKKEARKLNIDEIDSRPEIQIDVYDDIKRHIKTMKKMKKSAGKVGGDLGIVAFPHSRTDVLFDELNTPIEDKIETDLESFFHNSGYIEPDVLKKMIAFKSKGEYKDIFIDPKVSKIYRGMSIDSEGLKKLLRDKETFKSAVNSLARGKKYIAEVKLQFKPRGGASSWTTQKEIAIKFANQNAVEQIDFVIVKDKIETFKGDAALILHADATENVEKKFSGPGGLYNLNFADEYSHEKEIICVGNVNVYKVEIF